MTQQQQKTHNQTYSQRSISYIPPNYLQLLPDTQIHKEADRFTNHCFASQNQQQSNTPNQISNASIGPFNITYNNNTTDNDPNNNSNPKLTQPRSETTHHLITNPSQSNPTCSISHFQISPRSPPTSPTVPISTITSPSKSIFDSKTITVSKPQQLHSFDNNNNHNNNDNNNYYNNNKNILFHKIYNYMQEY